MTTTTLSPTTSGAPSGACATISFAAEHADLVGAEPARQLGVGALAEDDRVVGAPRFAQRVLDAVVQHEDGGEEERDERDAADRRDRRALAHDEVADVVADGDHG